MENGHSSYPILIVDDEPISLRSLELTLRTSAFPETIAVSDPREVKGILQRTQVDAVLLDLLMPHISGDDLLEHIADTFPGIPVIIITGNDTIDTAVECMKMGAFDYILKPVEKNRLVSAVSRAVEIMRLKRENENLRNYLLDSELKKPEAFIEIKTESESVRAIFRYVESIADTPYPVLITGETGVGKELVARAIHEVSGRRKGEFVAVNTAGLDENAFSDTLFGHVKGAFTGADSVSKGLIEQAAGGTLFLDEIGDLSSHLQVKLLRILQEYEYFPLGSDTARKTDARVIVATNRDLENLMESDTFRRDLYYRLAGHTIHIPPLRERIKDVPLLIRDFTKEACSELGIESLTVTREVEKLLCRYSFPGNIRELKMLCLNAAANANSGKLEISDIENQINKAYLGKRIPDTDPGELVVFSSSQLPTLKQVDTLLVKAAMNRADGVQAAAAELLGISRQALNNRIKKMS